MPLDESSAPTQPITPLARDRPLADRRETAAAGAVSHACAARQVAHLDRGPAYAFTPVDYLAQSLLSAVAGVCGGGIVARVTDPARSPRRR